MEQRFSLGDKVYLVARPKTKGTVSGISPDCEHFYVRLDVPLALRKLEVDEFHTFFLEPTIVPVVRVHFLGIKKLEV